jgi:methionine sulfoxide reductase heme-binding subunit
VATQILWFATRGAGIVSLLLLTAVTCLGLLAVVRWQSASWPRFLTVELHRNLALLSLVFLGVHIVTAVLDPFTSLGWLAAIVSLASSYRPVAVALGVIALDLMLALVITSLLRERIGQRAWRAVHWLAYGTWPLAAAHGITAGTDTPAAWMLAVNAICILAVVGALIWRVAAGRSNRSRLMDVVIAPASVKGTGLR